MDPNQTLSAEARRRWLASSAAGALVGTLSDVPSSYFHWIGTGAFSDWRDPFEPAYTAVRDGLEDKHDERIAGLVTGGLDGDGVHALRSLGVADRWRMETFFAREGGPAAKAVLGFHDTEGGQAIERLYDEKQFQAVLSGDRPTADGVTLRGHHINSVKEALTGSQDGSGLRSIVDGENIRIVSANAHLEQEHQGDFHNSSHGDASELTERHDQLVSANRAGFEHEAMDEARSHQVDTALLAGVTSGTLSGIVRLWSLREDPRPWKQKAGLAAITFANSAMVGGAISLAASAAGHVAREFVAERAEEIASYLGDDVGEGVLADLAGSGAAAGAGSIIRVSIRTVGDLRAGRALGRVSRDAGGQLLRVGAEQVAFLLLGLALDAVTPIPEPTAAAIVTGTRIAWSLGKFAFNYTVEKESAQAVRLLRLALQYQAACAALQPA